MNLNIPDKFYKFLVLSGAILVAFMYFQKEAFEKIYFDKIDIQNNLSDSLSIELTKKEFESKEMFNNAENLSKKYGVKNPVSYSKDSSLIFTQTLLGTKNAVIVSDSINRWWDKALLSEKRAVVLVEKMKNISKRLEDEEKLKNDRFSYLSDFENLGYFLLGLGLCMWMISEIPEADELKHYSKKLEDRTYIYCQSCGKKFTSMLKYGKESDKVTNNYAFCENCYQNGEFKDNDVTLENLIAESKLRNKKLPKIFQNIIVRRIKNLERWNLND